MRKSLKMLSALAVLLVGTQTALGLSDVNSVELDAYWTELARTVSEGDFEGYKAAYRPDAILVSTFSENSYPIAQALEGWEQGFIDTKEGKAKASVEFRFTQRLRDESTAHETGMFKYSFQPPNGDPGVQYVHFEALLIKKQGWKMMMEYQKSAGTLDDWEAAK